MSDDPSGYAPLTPQQQALVTENTRLVPWVARHYYPQQTIPKDIVSEGYVGLVIAASKFDSERGVKFNSYAVHWVRAKILDYIMRYRGPVKFMTNAACSKVCFGLNRLPPGMEDTDEIAKHFGVSREIVENMRNRMIGNDVQLDAVTEGMHFQIADRHEDQEELLGCAEEVSEAKRSVHDSLEQLDSRESFILRARYLGEDEDLRTLNSIGKEIGVSRERVRQIEKQAKKNLRTVLMGGKAPARCWGRPRKGVAV